MSVCLTTSEKDAIVKLLEDEDPATFDAIRARVLRASNEDALEWLQQYQLDPNPLVRNRVVRLTTDLSRRTNDASFRTACGIMPEDCDIEWACLLLSQTRYPNINPEGYSAWLDWVAGQISPELGVGMKPESIIATINNKLIDDLGFMGNQSDYYAPENSYLSHVIDNRSGNPISLGLIYSMIAKRLRLPIHGIGAPTHFFCCYFAGANKYYIDVFQGGKILSDQDFSRFLKDVGGASHCLPVRPISGKRALVRVLHNLRYAYRRQKAVDEIRRVEAYLKALEPEVALS